MKYNESLPLLICKFWADVLWNNIATMDHMNATAENHRVEAQLPCGLIIVAKLGVVGVDDPTCRDLLALVRLQHEFKSEDTLHRH